MSNEQNITGFAVDFELIQTTFLFSVGIMTIWVLKSITFSNCVDGQTEGIQNTGK